MTPGSSNSDTGNETVEDGIPVSLLDAIQQLLDERKELERFMEENCSRLGQIREEIREERARGEKDWREQLEALRQERDAFRQQSEGMTEQLKTAQLNLALAGEEMNELRSQLEQQRKHRAEAGQLLEAIQAELGRREEQRKSEAARMEQLEKEHAELLELMRGFETLEADLQQQQEAIRQEREALSQQRTQAGGSTVSGTTPVNRLTSLANQRLLAFLCKHCGAKLQAKERLAGLAMRCTNCNKMCPVPRS